MDMCGAASLRSFWWSILFFFLPTDKGVSRVGCLGEMWRGSITYEIGEPCHGGACRLVIDCSLVGVVPPVILCWRACRACTQGWRWVLDAPWKKWQGEFWDYEWIGKWSYRVAITGGLYSLRSNAPCCQLHRKGRWTWRWCTALEWWGSAPCKLPCFPTQYWAIHWTKQAQCNWCFWRR